MKLSRLLIIAAALAVPTLAIAADGAFSSSGCPLGVHCPFCP